MQCEEKQHKEHLVRDLLFDWLNEDTSHPAILVETVEKLAGEELPVRECWEVFREWSNADGSRIDILLRSESLVLAFELKVDANETPAQYCRYRATLIDQGYKPYLFGIVKTLHAKGGRKALAEGSFENVCHGRVSWRKLLSDLRLDERVSASVGVLEREVYSVDPELAIMPDSTHRRLTPKHVSYLESDTKLLMRFFRDVLATTKLELDGVPDQAGNSPILFRMGKAEWSEWFEDLDTHRLILEFDQNRPKSPKAQTDITFLVSIWNKGRSGRRRPLNVAKLSKAASFLAERNFEVSRNIISNWHAAEPWEAPYSVPPKGFFHAAGKQRKPSLYFRDMLTMGWQSSVEALAHRVIEISDMIDELVRSG